MSFKKQDKEKRMKKTIGVIAVICLTAALVAGCVSVPPASEGIQKARSGAPSGSLVASATGSSASASETAAKEQLAKALVAIATSIIQDSNRAGEINNDVSSELTQRMTNALTRSTLNSAIKQGQGTGKGNVSWTVYYMEKMDVVAEINRSLTAVKAAVPGSDSFSITSRIDEKYQAAIGRTWTN
jgi:predicted small secreted protein